MLHKRDEEERSASGGSRCHVRAYESVTPKADETKSELHREVTMNPFVLISVTLREFFCATFLAAKKSSLINKKPPVK